MTTEAQVIGVGVIGEIQSNLYTLTMIESSFSALTSEGTGLCAKPFSNGTFGPTLTFIGYGSNVHTGIGDFESPIRQIAKGRGTSLGNSWLAWFKVFNEN